MLFYLVCIFGGNGLIWLFNYLFNLSTFNGQGWRIILFSAVYTIAIIIIDGIFSTLVRWALPKKWFAYPNRTFCAKKWELKFYDKLGIKKWKDKIAELGSFTGFHKDKVIDPKNNEYIERFILEANYGIWCHVACSILGFSIFFIPTYSYLLTVALPVALVNFFLNLLPIMALRYNLPRLFVLHKFNLKKAELKKAA